MIHRHAVHFALGLCSLLLAAALAQAGDGQEITSAVEGYAELEVECKPDHTEEIVLRLKE